MLLRWSDLTPAHQADLSGWPPVALLDGSTVARLLGVRPSTLRNWRHRGIGPRAEPAAMYGRGAPSPIYYRVSNLLCWLCPAPNKAPWELERDWLVEHFVGWRLGTSSGYVDVGAEMSATDTDLAAASVREHSSDRLFNEAASLPRWPGRQPIQKQKYA